MPQEGFTGLENTLLIGIWDKNVEKSIRPVPDP